MSVVDRTSPSGELEAEHSEDVPEARSPFTEAGCDVDQLEALKELSGLAERHRGLAMWGLLLLGVVGVAYLARPVLMPLAFALLIDMLLKPVVIKLNRWGLPTPIGAILALGSGLLVIVIAVVILQAPASRWIADLDKHVESAAGKLKELRLPIRRLNDTTQKVAELATLPGSDDAPEVVVRESSLAGQLVNTSTGMFAGIGLALVAAYFMLAAGDRWLEKAFCLAPGWAERKQLLSLVRDVRHSVSGYLGVVTLVNISMGIAVALAMWGLGMPSPLLWGAAAALLNYVPFVGLIINVVLVAVAAILTFDSLAYAMVPPLAYLVINGIEANFVTPTFLGRVASVSPLALIVAMSLAGLLWGAGGVFLAAPYVVVLRIAFEHIRPLQPVGHLLAP